MTFIFTGTESTCAEISGKVVALDVKLMIKKVCSCGRQADDQDSV